MRAEIDSHIEKMLDAGLIEKSISGWQSPHNSLDTLGEAKAKIFPL